MAKKSLKDMSGREKKGIGVLAAIQFLLAGAALLDIWRRPKNTVRGNRALRSAACGINFFGPVAYFLFGRRAA